VCGGVTVALPTRGEAEAEGKAVADEGAPPLSEGEGGGEGEALSLPAAREARAAAWARRWAARACH
jgi:hypothetical protein